MDVDRLTADLHRLDDNRTEYKYDYRSGNYEIEIRMLENNPTDLQRAETERVVGNQEKRLLRQQQESKALSTSKGTTTADRGEKNRKPRNRFKGSCFSYGRNVTALRTAGAQRREINHEMPPSTRRADVGISATSVGVRSTSRINTVASVEAWSTELAILRSKELRKVGCWPK